MSFIRLQISHHGSCNMSQRIPCIGYTSSLANVHFDESLVCFKSFGFSDINMGFSPGLLLVTLCHGDPAALEQQDSPFHAPQPLANDTDFGMGQLREPWIWAWMAAELVSLTALPYLHHQGEHFSTAPGRPLSAAIYRRLGQLTCVHSTRTSSTVSVRGQD